MNFLRKFLYGRYGGDTLGWFTLALYLILYLLSLFFNSALLVLLSMAAAAVTLFRMLSRNIPKRQAENRWFLAHTGTVRGWWRAVTLHRKDKDHKYFRCPNCGQRLRVPRGAGKIRVTCRSCGANFEEKS